MIVLLAIGFLAGVVTAISPCVLPVLPIILAGGVSGESRRRPYAIVGGLALSFAVFTLLASWILRKLGLPQDFLSNAATVLLLVLGASLLIPQLGLLLERPFQRLGRRSAADTRSGFLLGLGLGLVFVPCAGPVLAVITVKAASLSLGLDTILLTAAYSLGVAVPMLMIARAAQRGARSRFFRTHAQAIRIAAGAAIVLSTVAIYENAPTRLQTALGDYTGALQRHIEESGTARKHLAEVRGGGSGVAAAATMPHGSKLPDYGYAPDFSKISSWLNTSGDRPLSVDRLRGKVVLIDFWTYSCINCLRTLPHVEAWDRAYRKAGLVIVGVHTPEFAFEHVRSNVASATRRLGVRYPVALDNDYGTWNAYGNQYWPAEYLVDRRGHVRHAHFGEGEYAQTEKLIRRLLAEPRGSLPAVTGLPDRTPGGLVTPETYLGSARLDRYVGSPIVSSGEGSYRLPRTVGQNELAYGGRWTVTPEQIVAGPNARLLLHFHAHNVYLVASGHGTIRALVDGKPERTIRVDGARLYTVLAGPDLRDGVLELRFAPGLAGYSFTFG